MHDYLAWSSGDRDGADPGPPGAPGKRTLTAALPPVQLRVDVASTPSSAPAAPGGGDDPFWFADAAANGVAGASAPLPHLDAIQRSFGGHDVGGVQVQVGGAGAQAADALGAEAYATGNRVAFAATPDLFTAAHEAAHIVQQRAGVHLKGGIGEAGDPYERHADEVAAAVVAGQSAEALLDRHAGGGAPTAGVQRRIRTDDKNEGQPLDPEQAVIPDDLSPAAMGLYRRWLRDDGDHHYATEAELSRAIAGMVVQPFGTDIALEYPDHEEQRQIFRQALDAGYRVFDTAFTYNTLENLWTAVTESEIPRNEITILYKVKPSDDEALEQKAVEYPPQRNQLEREKLTSRLDDGDRAMGGNDTPDVLMLHDLVGDDDVVANNLRSLAAKVVQGRAKAIGVSNATVFDLERLCPIAAEAQAPIKYVQNRCSPYHRDDEVRAYCTEHQIQYMAYGMMGSAQIGECAGVGNEGDGMPTQYLLARLDPRLQALAEELGISEGELLIGWAQKRGIAPVTFTSRPEQAQKNFDRAAVPLAEEVLQQLDEMFVTPSQVDRERIGDMPETSLRALYTAYEDPTAWSILDELGGTVGGTDLLTRLGDAVAAAHPDDLEARTAALKEMMLNLVRHVADIQSVIQLMKSDQARIIKSNRTAPQRGEEVQPVPPVAFTDWREKLRPAFAQLAQAAGAPQVFDALCAWAQRNPLTGGTMAHAEDAWRDIERTPAPQQEGAQEDEVAQVEVQVPAFDVPYDSGDLLDGSALAFANEGERTALVQGDTVCYQWLPHTVVSNQTETRTLTIRPN